VAFRCAYLQLRGPAGPLPARVRWPAPGGSGTRTRPGLLVLVTGAPGDVVPAPGLVVVALNASCTFEEALAATQWAADHADELGADPTCLLVGGTGAGEPLAAAVVAHAREDGWPLVRLAGEAEGWAS
jgi:acetyl esterase